MKTNEILTIFMAILSVAGCSDDMPMNELPVEEKPVGKVMRIGAGFAEGSTTRLGYEESDTKMALTWSAGDELQLFSTSSDTLSTTFTLTTGEGTSMAQFEAADVPFQVNEQLYALYCKGNQPETDADGDLVVSVEGQNGQLDERFQLMYGQTLHKEGVNPYFQLKHLTSLFKVTIPTEKELQSVTISGSGVVTKATLVLGKLPADAQGFSGMAAGDVVYSYQKRNEQKYGTHSNDQLTVKGPFTPVDGQVTVFFYVLAANYYWPNWGGTSRFNLSPQIKAVASDGTTMLSTTSYSSHPMMAGKMYELRPAMFVSENFRNEAEVDCTRGGVFELWTEDDLYTFMLRCKSDERNAQGWSYRNCNYKLMDNITLTDKMAWTPAYFYGKLDGAGKTLSGAITSTYGGAVLFDAVNGSTLIQNLTIHFSSIQFKTGGTQDCGLLCGNSYGATILHCTNLSDMNALANNIGGLVGYLHGGTTLYACGNEGTLSGQNGVDMIGGLVARSEGSFTMEACYNTGLLNFDGSAIAGGLVGSMTGGDGSVNACWTTNANGISVVGSGSYTDCYLVDSWPTAEEIAAMNAALKTTDWIFKATGKPGKNNNSTIPDIDEEEW